VVSLRPVNSYPDARQYVEVFVDDPKNKEFFRRIGPKFTWCNDASLSQMFATSYFIRDEDKVVGLISLVQTDDHIKSVEFGLLASKLKYAKEATQLFSEYVFDHLGYNKLWCRVIKPSSNLRGLGFLLSMGGFIKEGISRDSCFSYGKYQDELIYSKLRKDWLS
jgi:RimJ/RimL family protein N-acetyltransferase